MYPGDGRAKPELRGLQSTVGERRQAEDAIGNESDSNDDDDDHAPRFECEPAQCAIETGGRSIETVTPEPATYCLIGAGLAALGLIHSRRRQ